jgi:hypothetical protein
LSGSWVCCRGKKLVAPGGWCCPTATAFPAGRHSGGVDWCNPNADPCSQKHFSSAKRKTKGNNITLFICHSPGSIPGQVMWNLWWIKWYADRFPPSTSFSTDNSHSVKCSTHTSPITRGRYNRSNRGRGNKWTQPHPTSRNYLSMAPRPFVGPWPLFQFLHHFTQSVGFLGRGISSSQDIYLPTAGHKHGINTHRHPCLKWHSNPRSQCSSERRQFMP